MKGTRLWQDTGSPLISGRSRRVRPLSADITAALIGSLALWALLVATYAWLGRSTGQLVPSSLIRSAPGAVIGALLGVLPSVSVARAWGVRRPWVVGAIVGLVGATIVGFVSSPYLAMIYRSV